MIRTRIPLVAGLAITGLVAIGWLVPDAGLSAVLSAALLVVSILLFKLLADLERVTQSTEH